MNRLNYYMSLPYKIELIPDVDEGGFGVSIPDLPGCISIGATIDDAINNINDAKRAWIEAALEDGITIPEPQPDKDLTEYSGQFKLRIPKSLHKSLVRHAKAEGISMNQYCLYLLTKNDEAEGA